MTRFDAIIIGAGQAGPPLAARLAAAGQQVAIIERHLFGGTCVNTGCIPTKTLIASARTAWVARNAASFGVDINGSISVDMAKVKARKDEISSASRTGLENWLGTTGNCTVLRGHARFASDHEITIGEQQLKADRIFINVGARASVPHIAGLDATPYLTNSSMMDLDTLPGHLVIVGGSYVGLEFAQMYRRFGSRVTVVEKGARLLGREDEDVSGAIGETMAREGIDVRLNAECIAVSGEGGGIAVRSNCENTAFKIEGTHLLLALGRTPNTDDLGLENTSIKRDSRGFIQVNDELQTVASGVWALGECNGRGAFTHTSYNDYEIVAANLLEGVRRRVSERIPAYALYTDPPLGRAGLTESEVLGSGKPALAGRRPMSKVGRAVERGEPHGFIKILVDAESKRILGAAILGVEGDEAIHCILDAMYAKVPYTTLQRATHIHPTVSELIPTVLSELAPLKRPAAMRA